MSGDDGDDAPEDVADHSVPRPWRFVGDQLAMLPEVRTGDLTDEEHAAAVARYGQDRVAARWVAK